MLAVGCARILRGMVSAAALLLNHLWPPPPPPPFFSLGRFLHGLTRVRTTFGGAKLEVTITSCSRAPSPLLLIRKAVSGLFVPFLSGYFFLTAYSPFRHKNSVVCTARRLSFVLPSWCVLQRSRASQSRCEVHGHSEGTLLWLITEGAGPFAGSAANACP